MKILISLLIIVFVQSANASLVINEVLSNEPGGFTSLEWLELYNNSNNAVELSDYQLVINSNTVVLPIKTILPYTYQVICKNLYSVSDENSFESYWGNSSKIWGDNSYEQEVAEPVEASFSLPNDFGTIQLVLNQTIVSSFHWNESGVDAVSWERKFIDSSLILQSESRIFSTPGLVNSITLLDHDISIDSVSIVVTDFIPYYTFQLSNRGYTDITDGLLSIYDSSYNLILTETLENLESETKSNIEISFNYNSVNIYNNFIAVIETSGDVRAVNDTLQFVGVSEGYPPLIISEFLANPQDVHESEWIEIYNKSPESIDLQNWFIGDALKLVQISAEQLYILPNEYIVLVKSENEFLLEYPMYSNSKIVELSSWATLNNIDEKIRIVDIHNIEADAYSYDDAFDSNFTFVRDIEGGSYKWGRSSEQFGSPGSENILFVIDDVLQLRLSSKYISPDGDGYEDDLIIYTEVPYADSYSLKLYDTDGHLVKIFYSEQKYISNQFVWDGFGDDSQKLPIGIYILYLETEDGKSTKETIVIAR